MYFYTALMNHSCDPTTTIEPAQTKAARLHIRCYRDVVVGEELTFNYGPKELATQMNLSERRAYMLANHQFVCQCRRCVAEEQIDRLR